MPRGSLKRHDRLAVRRPRAFLILGRARLARPEAWHRRLHLQRRRQPPVRRAFRAHPLEGPRPRPGADRLDDVAGHARRHAGHSELVLLDRDRERLAVAPEEPRPVTGVTLVTKLHPRTALTLAVPQRTYSGNATPSGPPAPIGSTRPDPGILPASPGVRKGTTALWGVHGGDTVPPP